MTKKLKIVISGVMICLCNILYADTTISHDQNCLAEAIYREAGGEKLIGQYAVGEVIMNRVHIARENSVCAVVNQHFGKHWQFGYNTLSKKSIPLSRKEYFLEVAENILDGSDEFSFPGNVLYYNNRPFKSKKYKIYCKIGNQIFYTLRNSEEPVKFSVPLYGTREVLLHQDEMAKQYGLTPIKNNTDLEKLIESNKLVPIPTSKYLTVSSKLPQIRRYCRPWVANFLQDISYAYYQQFKKPLVVDSAVRTQQFQKKLRRYNRNAAAVTGEAESPHLTGIAVDLNKRNFSERELFWMRQYLTFDALAGKLDVEEEFSQKCFHISVYKVIDLDTVLFGAVTVTK